MNNAFSLPSLFFGIYLIVPLLLGGLLLFTTNTNRGTLAQAQHLGGALLLLDAIYLIVRTSLLANHGIENIRLTFFVLDSTIITLFNLIPYTVITERYPHKWMYLVAMSPLLLLPVIHITESEQIAIYSHLLPIVVAILVLLLSIKHVRKADSNLMDTYANPERYSKSWIIHLSALFILVSIASLLRYVLHGMVWYNITVSLMWSMLMVVIYIFLSRQQSTHNETHMVQIPAPAPENTTDNALKNRNFEMIEQALQKNCVEEQMYLNGDLSVDSLARACNTNRTYLSTYLHERKNKTFYEYINTMRLVKVDELLNNQKLSLEAIATQCGFNSARTMRMAYRKLKGKNIIRPNAL